MGIGDEIIVTGEVRKRQTPYRFGIFDLRKNVQRWNDIWTGNPRIAMPGQPFDSRMYNSGGMRPYIADKTARRWVWKPFGPTPGEIFLSEQERACYVTQAMGAVVVQPEVKPSASPNKRWPFEYWEELVRMAPHLRWVQVGAGHEQRIAGTTFVHTPTFRHACAVLSGARATVLQEGGLHHAAAALGVPAVVVFGGFISPQCTGYEAQRSLFQETPEHPLGCGMRQQCYHCEVAMRGFLPRKVLRELERML